MTAAGGFLSRLDVRRSTRWFVVCVIVPTAVLSIALQRHGQSWGDDFALYLRQAKGLVDGDVGQVLADNKVNVDSAAKPGFSPYAYPWVFPVLLAPLVWLWGVGSDRLKLVGVACLCGYLWCWFVLLRARMVPWLAGLAAAVTAYSVSYLTYTDALLSELPYMFLTAATFCFIDRYFRDRSVRDRGASESGCWIRAPRRSLVLLGLLMMLVFNTRREGIAMVGAVIVAQALDVWRVANIRRVTVAARQWTRLAIPHVTFVASVGVGQLLLPSSIAPRYAGAGLGQTWRKLRTTFQDSVLSQLGLSHTGIVGRMAIGVLVVLGIIVTVRRHADANLPFVAFAGGSLTIVGMVPADQPRYTMAVTPFALYFGLQAMVAMGRSRAMAAGVVAVALIVANAVGIPGALLDRNDVRRADEVVPGPWERESVEMFGAVRTYTGRDDMVAFFKARALTLFTDRRAVQSSDLAIVLERADWYVMAAHGDGVYPLLTADDAVRLGAEKVWHNDAWVLWRLPESELSSLLGPADVQRG
jgi:hypothetical protein